MFYPIDWKPSNVLSLLQHHRHVTSDHGSLLIMLAVTIISVKCTLIKIQNIDIVWPIFYTNKTNLNYWKRRINSEKCLNSQHQLEIKSLFSWFWHHPFIRQCQLWVSRSVHGHMLDSDFKFQSFKDIRVKQPGAGLAWRVLPAHHRRRLTVNDNDTKLQTLTFHQLSERDEKLKRYGIWNLILALLNCYGI